MTQERCAGRGKRRGEGSKEQKGWMEKNEREGKGYWREMSALKMNERTYV